MANNNSKKKKNTNNKKNNTKKVDTTKKVNKVEKKEVKKVTSKEEVKVEKVTEKVKKEKKPFKLTSKQRDIILVLLAAILLVIAVVLTGNKNKLDIELPIALEGTPGFTEITYEEYEEKLNTEAPFVVVIKRDGCKYCEMYDPVVTDVVNEYGLPFYYINLTNLTYEEQQALSMSNSYLKKSQWGTPTTLFMYGNTVVDTIEQYVNKEKLVEFVKENFVVGTNEAE